jgi:hypothetical protein
MTDQRPNDDAGRVSVIQTDANQGRKTIYNNATGEWYDIELGGKYVLRIVRQTSVKMLEIFAKRVNEWLSSSERPVLIINKQIELVRLPEPDKPFLLFSLESDSPDFLGGWDDFEAAYSSIDNAERAAKEIQGRHRKAENGMHHYVDYWHIVDIRKLEIVKMWSAP